MSNEKEVRSLDSEDAEVRAIGESRNIEGYGIVFNKESRNLGGFTEIILPSAMDGVLERSDVLALMNHDVSRGVLARSTYGKGSMKLTIDKRGVKYTFEAPKHNLGNELLEGVIRGDIRSSSFGFTVGDGQKWERRSDGTTLRTITKFDAILDVSPVYNPAYVDASVAIRSLDEFNKTDADAQVIPEATLPTAKTVDKMMEEVKPQIRNIDLCKLVALRNKNNQFKQKL